MRIIPPFLKAILPTITRGRVESRIQFLLDLCAREGRIDVQSCKMIRNILSFRNTIAREVMIPRTDIIAVSNTATINEIIDVVIVHGHTRMPVYSGSVDNIVGILNVKDLLKTWRGAVKGADITGSLRTPHYIPETKKTHILLRELKQMKYHMAIVIDEYGGTSGLVTLEDLIEEIVGEIHDEHDTKEEGIIEAGDGYSVVDGRTEIDEVEEYFGVQFPDGKHETISGLILSSLKRIPVAGDSVKLGNLEMVIEAADERSIKKIKIKKMDTGETAR